MSRGPKMGDDDACIQEGIYFVTKGSTLRKMAKVFNKSPSTIKKDLDHIEDLDKGLYAQVRNKCKSISINDASVVVNPQEKNFFVWNWHKKQFQLKK